jgi:hypothetical protein
MNHRTFLRSALLAVLTLGLGAAGCSDLQGPAEPFPAPQVRVGGPFLSLSPAAETVKVLRRNVPLAADLEVTQVIGPAGGVIDLVEAGLQVTVPTGALLLPTPITVTALAGDLVAYTFEPHGLQFARVVSAEQSLLGTAGIVGNVDERGYFTSTSAIDWSSGSAVVSEVSLVQPILTSTSVRFFLNHFSGYLLAVD